MHEVGRPPWPCGGNINKEIEKSRHKRDSTLFSLTIHFPITEGDTGTKWSPSIFPLAQNRSRHQQQYSFTFCLSHTNKDAGRCWPPAWIWNSLGYWVKWKITRLNPVDSFQFLTDRIWYHKHIKFVSETKCSGKMLKSRECTRVNRKMYGWEAGELWPGSAHPYRLWLDIWSQSQWNVRQVMTGMVIGRLWLTSDLEVLKGHSSLNRLWADVLSRWQKGR